ncbi:MAG: phytoene/squalene synthase family protein [Sandaracinaceae bacterium]
MDPVLAAECRAILGEGSKSFATAARLLPPRLRDPVAAFYAFCRVSDDAVDRSADPARSLAELRDRLDRLYDGTPDPHPADRGMAWVAAAHAIPRPLLDALLEGYGWDAEARPYPDLSSVLAYSARVAGSVGVVMTLLMGRREVATLRRAAAMGVAMQLTNIARDVGEDARHGRVYLPETWLREEGLSAEALRADPAYRPGVGVAVCRLLAVADVLYRRADGGVAALPADCRTAIRAARLIYADIGRSIRDKGHDSVSSRAFTTPARKAVLLAASIPARWRPWSMHRVTTSLQRLTTPAEGRGPSWPAEAPGLEEAEFLIRAVHEASGAGKVDAGRRAGRPAQWESRWS